MPDIDKQKHKEATREIFVAFANKFPVGADLHNKLIINTLSGFIELMQNRIDSGALDKEE